MFLGGQLNMCYNAVDRHVDSGAAAQWLVAVAILGHTWQECTSAHIR